jgi:hypothetical protein
VSTTLSAKQIQSLPLTSRDALQFVVNLPGVNTPGTARNSTVSGLPQGSINITLDGISIQDNFLKTTDGFFARVQPRLDAIEEVTVTTGGQRRRQRGQGAVNIRFVTKSGTNNFKGNMFFTLRHDALNANTFFNNRNLPADPDTGKAPSRSCGSTSRLQRRRPDHHPRPLERARQGVLLLQLRETPRSEHITREPRHPAQPAMHGHYTYGNTTVTCCSCAARNGQLATLDPTVAQAVRRHADGQRQRLDLNLSDPILQQASLQVRSDNFTPYRRPRRLQHQQEPPADRLVQLQPHQLDARHDRTTASRSSPASRTPAASSRRATRRRNRCARRSARTWSTSSASAPRAARRFLAGAGAGLFGGNIFGDQGGYFLNIGNGCCSTALANAGGSANFSAREGSTRVVEDTVNWLKGTHNMSFGASWTARAGVAREPAARAGAALRHCHRRPARACSPLRNFPNASDRAVEQRAARSTASLTGPGERRFAARCASTRTQASTSTSATASSAGT